MSKYSNLTSLFDDIADSIRSKTGDPNLIKAEDFPNEINKIIPDPSGDATATADDILASKTAYAQGQKLTGTIPTKTKSDVSIDNHIATVPTGYYASNITVAASEVTSGNLSLQSSVSAQTGINAINYATVSVDAMASESKSATPTSAIQEITPASGKLIDKVTVAAVPYNEEENIRGGLTVEIL